jgi:aryl-alcohol dehydrogenase-like predicted oxidoreductase
MDFKIKNGYKISALTLGTVQFGLAYGINNDKGMPSFEESSAIIDTALSAGIVSFDTARGYGESENVLGRYFKNETREKTIITKVIFEDVDKSQVKDTLFSQLGDAKAKLGLDKIPFVKLHREQMLEKYGDTLVRAMQDAKSEGLVDGIGVSFSDKSKILELTDGCGFDVIQMPANIFDNKEIVNGTVKHLADSGALVMIRSVYLQGLFFKDTNTLEGKIKCAKEPLDKLHKLAKDAGVSMAELAITFIRDTEGIASLILGCDNPAQLLESVSLVNAPKISESVRREALEIASTIDPIVIRPWEWFK